MRKKKTEQVEETVVQPSAVQNDTGALPPDAEKVNTFLREVLTKMGVSYDEILVECDDEYIRLTVNTPDANSVIGYHGEVLDALQYLCSLQLGSRSEGARRVVIDTEGYRERREKALKRLAGNLEQKVKRTGRPAKLEPMNPYERRIIHTALQNSEYVVTASEGEGNARHVVISPKGKEMILNAPNAPRKTLNFVYRSEKKRRR